MANNTLMMWGAIQWQVWPMNIHAYDHLTGTDFARKDVMETSPRREWVGEKDEQIAIRGRMFPLAIGGFANLEAFEGARRAGQSHMLIRGGGTMAQVLGWYLCEDLRRLHEHLAPNGIGKVINFEATFARDDIPRAATYYSSVFDMITGRV